jgi:hypothetical protein
VSFSFDALVLNGPLVRLEPLTQHHASDLAAAAEENRDSWDPRFWPDTERLSAVEVGFTWRGVGRGRRAVRGRAAELVEVVGAG